MNKIQKAARHKSVAAAVGSVRAEGLRPSLKTRTQLRHYADGGISASDLRSRVVWEVKSKARKTK